MDCLCTILALSISDSFIAFFMDSRKGPKIKEVSRKNFWPVRMLDGQGFSEAERRKNGLMIDLSLSRLLRLRVETNLNDKHIWLLARYKVSNKYLLKKDRSLENNYTPSL